MFLHGDDNNDVILQVRLRGNDVINGGQGIDTLDYSQAQVINSSITADLGASPSSKNITTAYSSVPMLSRT